MYPSKAQVIDLRSKVRTPAKTRMIFEELQKRASLSTTSASLNNSALRLQEFATQLEKDANKPYWRFPRPSARPVTPRIADSGLLSEETTPVNCNVTRITPQLKTIVQRRRIEPRIQSNVLSVSKEDLETDSDFHDAISEHDLAKAPPLSVSNVPKAGFLSNLAVNEVKSLIAPNNMENTSSKSFVLKRKHPISFEFEAPLVRGPKQPKAFISIGICTEALNVLEKEKVETVNISTQTNDLPIEITQKTTLSDATNFKPASLLSTISSNALPAPSNSLPAPSNPLFAISSVLPAPSNPLPTPSNPLSAPSNPLTAPSNPLIASLKSLDAPSNASTFNASSTGLFNITTFGAPSAAISNNTPPKATSNVSSTALSNVLPTPVPSNVASTVAPPLFNGLNSNAFQFGQASTNGPAEKKATFSFAVPSQPTLAPPSGAAFNFASTNTPSNGLTLGAFQFGSTSSNGSIEKNVGFSFAAPSQSTLTPASGAFNFTATNTSSNGLTSGAFQFGNLTSSSSGTNLFNSEPSTNRVVANRKYLAAKRKTMRR